MRKFLLFLALTGLISVAAPAKNKINIACIGNSITYGYGIPDRENNSYPAQLQQLLGTQYQVNNFGVSGATLMKSGNWPYTKDEQYQKALASNPDIVLIKLGTNDSKLINRVHIRDFQDDYAALIHTFQALPSHPRVILLTPIPSFSADTAQIWDKVIREMIIPNIEEVAFREKLEVVNLHFLFAGKQDLLPDKIHPNAEGAAIIAGRLAELIREKRDTSFNIMGDIPQEQSISSFYGYTCADFRFAGTFCKVVQPKWSATGHPWIWRARFWGHEPQTDVALLERGFHLVYCDVVELFGNTEAIDRWNQFYTLLHNAGLAKKVVLEGMSRGGIYIYNWAAVNRNKVACIYADNPVLDLNSWPSGFAAAPRYATEYEALKKDYGLTTDEHVKALHNSPVDKVRQIVKGHYAMLHLLGDADEVVPPTENTLIFEKRIKDAGGAITVIHKPGFGHHPHSLPDPTPIVQFILAHCKH